MRWDGVVRPSPACLRALLMVEHSLLKDGHEVIQVHPPDMPEALELASQLLNADGCQMFESFRRPGEWLDEGAAQMRRLARLPGPLRYLYYLWVKYVRRDGVWAGLIKDWRAKTALENWHLVKQREAFRAKWFDWWNAQELDVIITPPNATPAVPHDAMHDAVSSCGYTFLFNLASSAHNITSSAHANYYFCSWITRPVFCQLRMSKEPSTICPRPLT